MSANVALLILAGGDGSRLGFEGPKGCFVVPSLKKSLFEVLCEKAKKAHLAHVAIMTSTNNHEQTVAFFKEHDFFGLHEKSVHFFQQASLPMQELDGRALEQRAPCGNGDVFAAFKRAAIGQRWKQVGVRYVQVVPIDNPLAPVVDDEMIAAHELGADLVVRAIKKQEHEAIGSLVSKRGRLTVIEYSEQSAHHADSPGYTGLFSMTLDLLIKLGSYDLPWHEAKKQWQGREVVKREKFIFDAFCEVSDFKVIESERSTVFAPIKSEQDVYKYPQVQS